MITGEAALTSSHEAAHVAAAIRVGRPIELVVRQRHEQGGATITLRPDGEDPVKSAQDLVVVHLAALYECGPRGADSDVEKARFLGGFTGVDLDAQNDRTRALVKDPEFRRVHRIVEFALWEHPLMSGDEIELLLALEEERNR